MLKRKRAGPRKAAAGETLRGVVAVHAQRKERKIGVVVIMEA